MTRRNERLARQFFQEVWNERRIDAVAELTHSEEVVHFMNGEEVPAERFRDDIHGRFLDAFPNLRMEIDDLVADERHAVVRWTASGTHLGDGLGVKASGQNVRVHGMTWFTFRDGKISAGWDSWDHGGLLQTLWRTAPPLDDHLSPAGRRSQTERPSRS